MIIAAGKQVALIADSISVAVRLGRIPVVRAVVAGVRDEIAVTIGDGIDDGPETTP